MMVDRAYRCYNISERNIMEKEKSMLGFENDAYRVIEFYGRDSRLKSLLWLCECKLCGKRKIKSTARLNENSCKGCGCLQRFINKDCKFGVQFKRTHGKLKHPLYRTWTRMKERCYGLKPTSPTYKYYVGVEVYDEWKKDFMTFYNWAISSGWTHGMTIDRKDSLKNYTPDNCQWLSRSDHSSKTALDSIKKGKPNPAAKLTKDMIYEIRYMLDMNIYGSHIARIFNVSRTIICAIRKGHIWKDA